MVDAITQFERLLTSEELAQLQSMKSPFRIQTFLDSTLYPPGERNRSPSEVLRERQAHCLDGGLFAAAALRRIGYPALIVDMQPEPGTDDDHVLAVFQEFGCWGAVAKSNYSGLRYREPIYATIRELVLSYFDDFFNVHGQKTLRTYTAPIDLAAFDDWQWMTEASGVDRIEELLKRADLTALITEEQARYLSPVDERSFKAGTLGINPKGTYKPQ
ncbi:MAG TPA: hypothetical protein PLL88_03785 [Anaerolineaceae bacterium]|jgi:hypothetical protein|nr:hypothetical protein [Anaerolineaceae bacterium]